LQLPLQLQLLVMLLVMFLLLSLLVQIIIAVHRYKNTKSKDTQAIIMIIAYDVAVNLLYRPRGI
jgi:uncharacterized membrane protein YqjE